jgi:hypothetical protein
MRGIKDLAQQPIRLMDRATLRSYVNLLDRELSLARAALATLDANEGVAIGGALPHGHTTTPPNGGHAAAGTTGGNGNGNGGNHSPQLGAMASPQAWTRGTTTGGTNTPRATTPGGSGGTSNVPNFNRLSSTFKFTLNPNAAAGSSSSSSSSSSSAAAAVQRSIASVAPAPPASTATPPSPTIHSEARFRLAGTTSASAATPIGSTTTTAAGGGSMPTFVKPPSRLSGGGINNIQVVNVAPSIASSSAPSITSSPALFHTLPTSGSLNPSSITLDPSPPPQSRAYIVGHSSSNGNTVTINTNSNGNMNTADQVSPSTTIPQHLWSLDRPSTSAVATGTSTSPNMMTRAPLLVMTPSGTHYNNNKPPSSPPMGATVPLHRRPNMTSPSNVNGDGLATPMSPTTNTDDTSDALLPHTVPPS